MHAPGAAAWIGAPAALQESLIESRTPGCMHEATETGRKEPVERVADARVRAARRGPCMERLRVIGAREGGLEPAAAPRPGAHIPA